MLKAEEYLSFDWGLTYLTGISDLGPRTLRYMMRPHTMTSVDFFKYYDETIELIKKYMHTKADLVPVVGPGRAAMDAALNSFIEPGEKCLFIDNGYWGRYAAEVIAPHYGIKVELLSFEAEKQIDLDIVEKKLKELGKDLKAVHMVHVETEIGAINPIRQVGALIKKYAPGALFIVDSASAFPGNPLETDKWGIDIDYFVSHKGFNGPSGLNFVSVNKRARRVLDKRKIPPSGWMTSIQTWLDTWVDCPSDSRHCLESFPIPTLHAIRAKLELLEIMGEDFYLKKYEIASRALREGIRHMTQPAGALIARGPACKGCPGCDAKDPNLVADVKTGRLCAQTMFAMAYPRRFPWKKYMDILENSFWIVAPHFGFGDARKKGYFYSKNGMRIGMVRDDQHYPRNIVAMLTAAGIGLRECGVRGVKWEKGVEKAVDVMKEYRRIGFKMYGFKSARANR
jgi:aspartate aminotransferase-like enzyme